MTGQPRGEFTLTLTSPPWTTLPATVTLSAIRVAVNQGRALLVLEFSTRAAFFGPLKAVLHVSADGDTAHLAQLDYEPVTFVPVSDVSRAIRTALTDRLATTDLATDLKAAADARAGETGDFIAAGCRDAAALLSLVTEGANASSLAVVTTALTDQYRGDLSELALAAAAATKDGTSTEHRTAP